MANIIKVKLLYPEAKPPFKSNPNDGCWDVFAHSFFMENDIVKYGTGIAVEPPSGYDLLIFPRSSICNQELMLANSIGYVDNEYRGELILAFRATCPSNEVPHRYMIGDRIGQIRLIAKDFSEIQVVDELTSTTRGEKGFGSTGRS